MYCANAGVPRTDDVSIASTKAKRSPALLHPILGHGRHTRMGAKAIVGESSDSRDRVNTRPSTSQYATRSWLEIAPPGWPDPSSTSRSDVRLVAMMLGHLLVALENSAKLASGCRG